MSEREPRTPVYKKELEIDFLPRWIKEDTWRVYKKYWIEADYQPPQTAGGLKFERGKYIRWEFDEEFDTPEYYDELTSYTLYELSDYPDIFLKFARIGKSVDPKESAVRSFFTKYGALNFAYGETNGFYSYTTFCNYANEAYYCLNLYQSILSNKIDTVRESIINGLNYPGLRDWIVEFFEVEGLFIPEPICEKYYNKVDPNIIEKHRQQIPDGFELSYSIGITYYINEGTNGSYERWCEVFTDAIKNMPPDLLIERAASAIGQIINKRLLHSTRLSIKLVYSAGGKLGNYNFADNWGAKDLLSKMWFTFYLMVTDKLKQEYKICPVCGELIKPQEGERLRTNQIYHATCRQTLYNRKRRKAEKLFREGMPIEDIIASTGVTERAILKWVNGKNTKPNHNATESDAIILISKKRKGRTYITPAFPIDE